MQSTRSFGPSYSNLLLSSISISTRLLFILVIGVVALGLSGTQASAQYGSLPIGQVINVPQNPVACPGTGWYPGMNCFPATVTNCAGTTDMNFYFGYLKPPGTVNGLIVFFNGSDGTAPKGDATGPIPGEISYIRDYLSSGYEIVQVAWSLPWQQAYFPWPFSTQPLGNVQAAACRPATFLNYVFNSPNMYQDVLSHKPTAGMCAQGASAGSAQIAYSMAYYGPPAGSQWRLDNVELISGPTLSDMEQGCQVPGPPALTSICPVGQYGCQLGSGGSPWALSPTYLEGPNHGVGSWTDDNSCANGVTTTQSSNAKWLAQSIVDQGTGAAPIFHYPNTAMSAWLCRSVANPQTPQNCAQYPVKYDNNCPNNSGSQGEIFYAQINQSNAPPFYNVYAVDNCAGPEGASSTGSTVPAIPLQGGGYQDGYDAIKNDMLLRCTH